MKERVSSEEEAPLSLFSRASSESQSRSFGSLGQVPLGHLAAPVWTGGGEGFGITGELVACAGMSSVHARAR